MGVRVIETDPDAYDVEDCASACYSYVTNATTATTTPPPATTKTPLNAASAEFRTEMPTISRSSRDLVGNCKEFRIEHNKSDLRIIGNGNLVRIACNDGSLQIIGNSTRLKILSNAGHIKYTGNDGRISLGGDSTQRNVEYVGCNGLLKVVKSGGSGAKQPDTCFTIIDDITKSPRGKPTTVTLTTTAIPTGSASPLRTTKSKSASYGGMDKNSHWQQFNELFKRRTASASISGAASSMPNLKENNYQHNNNNNNNNGKNNNSGSKSGKSGHISQCFHINSINCVGDIVIRNAVNLSVNSQ